MVIGMKRGWMDAWWLCFSVLLVQLRPAQALSARDRHHVVHVTVRHLVCKGLDLFNNRVLESTKYREYRIE